MEKAIFIIGFVALVLVLFLAVVVYPLYQESQAPAPGAPVTPQAVTVPPDDRLQRLPPPVDQPVPAPAAPAPAPVTIEQPRPSEPLQRLQLVETQITQLQALHDRLAALEARLDQLSSASSTISPEEVNTLRQQLSALGTDAGRPARSSSTSSTAVTEQVNTLSGRIGTLENKATTLETNVTKLESMLVSPQSNWNR